VDIYCAYLRKGKGKGKAVPLQAWSGPEDSRKLKQSCYRPGVVKRVPES
jgi:hypothetical protein